MCQVKEPVSVRVLDSSNFRLKEMGTCRNTDVPGYIPLFSRMNGVYKVSHGI